MSLLRSSGKRNEFYEKKLSEKYNNLLILTDKSNKKYNLYNSLYDSRLKDINNIVNNKFESVYKEKLKCGLASQNHLVKKDYQH